MSSQIFPPTASSSVSHAKNKNNPPAFMVPFFKMPLILYRLGLGWMLGNRFMLLTHQGRRTGRVYRSVLAVLRINNITHEVFAVSPWSSSNWYSNIQGTPAVEIETGRVRYAPAQRNLSPEEIASLFIEFRRLHPIFSRIISRIPGWNIESSYDEFLELARTLSGVAFFPKRIG
jgi:deazaflavin-dependent oxidoreductase (nitroreductase family)